MNIFLQAALAEFEAEAETKTRLLLAQQDDFLKAAELVDRINAHLPEAAEKKIELILVRQWNSFDFMISGHRHDSSAVAHALASAGLEIGQIADGFSDHVKEWPVIGYPMVKFFMPSDAVPWPAAIQEAA